LAEPPSLIVELSLTACCSITCKCPEYSATTRSIEFGRRPID